METKFNSQICTTREQSERLIALGLKKETADMMYEGMAEGELPRIMPYKTEMDYFNLWDSITPAWSLHRLLCLYGLDYTIKEVYNNAEECYGMLISAIGIAIEDGDFNKEYLV